MPILQTQLNARSADFRANVAAMDEVVADLRATVARIAHGGPESARQKHLARGKLLPRERVSALIDPGSSFLELSQLAAYGMYGEATPFEVPAASLITGIGRVNAVECMIVANDATVKGGTYYPVSYTHRDVYKRQPRASIEDWPVDACAGSSVSVSVWPSTGPLSQSARSSVPQMPSWVDDVRPRISSSSVPNRLTGPSGTPPSVVSVLAYDAVVLISCPVESKIDEMSEVIVSVPGTTQTPAAGKQPTPVAEA